MELIKIKNESKFMVGVLLGVVIGGASFAIPNLVASNKHHEVAVQSPSKSFTLKNADVHLIMNDGKMVGTIVYKYHTENGYEPKVLDVLIEKGSISKMVSE